MATPHVSGVAALVWSNVPLKTNAELRAALQATAEDLGPAGKDNAYGYGLVRADAALKYLGGGTIPENTPPTAKFSYGCTELRCTFKDESTDSDGSVAYWDWQFGDNETASSPSPTHVYSTAGTYTVKLTVTDNRAATNSVEQQVTVSGTGAGISLSARGYKVKGVKTVDLTWGGASTQNVDIHRNGVLLTSTPNDGAYTDRILLKGGGTYTYKVCDEGTTRCSIEVAVVF
jgi:PKD repeat protein